MPDLLTDSPSSRLRRIRMPDARYGTTRRFMLGTFDVYLTVNFYANDQPGEIFVKVAKEGSLLSGVLDTIAVQASMLLQVGVPAERVFNKMVGTQFEPSDHKYLSFADAIAREALSMIAERGGVQAHDYNNKPVDWNGE